MRTGFFVVCDKKSINNENTINKGGIEVLDLAKAVSIILVVVGHYFPDDSPHWYVGLRTVIYSFHMPLFMFVSGYIYSCFKKNEGYFAFLWKKVKRLIIPYFTTSFVVITLKLLIENQTSIENPVTIMSYLKMFYQPEAGYFLWFIWALWWMFVVIPLFKTRKSRVLLWIIACMLSCISAQLTKVFALQETCKMFIYFVSGAICFDLMHIFYVLKKHCSGWGLLFAPILFLSLYMIELKGIGHIVLAFAGISMILSLSQILVLCMKHRVGWWFTIAGSSYIIYLFHTTFNGFANAFLSRCVPLLYSCPNLFVLRAFLIILFGVFAPVILHRFVLKRFKLTRVLFGLP